MGLNVLTNSVANATAPAVFVSVECLVDSGIVHSIVPREVLAKLKIAAIATQEFRLTNGDRVVRDKGVALFSYDNRIGFADVVFGEEGDSVLLGALTLEALGLSLDPLRRELKPLPLLLAIQSA